MKHDIIGRLSGAIEEPGVGSYGLGRVSGA